jgi:hypothetical protein
MNLLNFEASLKQRIDALTASLLITSGYINFQ